jgi:hypothetical protein
MRSGGRSAQREGSQPASELFSHAESLQDVCDAVAEEDPALRFSESNE